MTQRLAASALLFAIALLTRADQAETAVWFANLAYRYRVTPDIPYLSINGRDVKLDVFTPRNPRGPFPTMVYIHGGGWVRERKGDQLPHLLPYLKRGWAVVNVEYRLAGIALAPAAVEDCRCALRWVKRNAAAYSFDVNKIVVTGHSAGGHLALMAAMPPASAGFDRHCPGGEALNVAAVVNWHGITDVNDLLDGENAEEFAVEWLGNQADRDDIARRVSPLRYVRPDLPPVLTIHGDADPVVPYRHAAKLHEALDGAGVPNRLLTISANVHGKFTRRESLNAYIAVREFLTKHGIQ